MFDFEEYQQRLKMDCQFVSVRCNPRPDGYGADTIVQLTKSQANHFRTLPEIEIKGKLLASQSMASFLLRGGNMCKEPRLSLNGDVLVFSGSVLAAQAFLNHFFCKK